MDRRRTCLVVSAVVFFAAAATACEPQEEEPDSYSYCVDNDTGMIVSDSHCGCPDDDYMAVDSNGNPVSDSDDDDDITYRCRSHPYPYAYSYWVTTKKHKPGYRVPKKFRKDFVNPGNPKARAKVGLSPKGPVKSGTKISGGGVGKGSGSHSSGHSSGG